MREFRIKQKFEKTVECGFDYSGNPLKINIKVSDDLELHFNVYGSRGYNEIVKEYKKILWFNFPRKKEMVFKGYSFLIETEDKDDITLNYGAANFQEQRIKLFFKSNSFWLEYDNDNEEWFTEIPEGMSTDVYEQVVKKLIEVITDFYYVKPIENK